MSERQPDRRVKITKRILKEALIENLKRAPLYEISVTQICEDADINRSTFYRYYNSVNELYEEVLNDIQTEITSKTEPNPYTGYNSVSILSDLFNYIDKNIDMMRVIIDSDTKAIEDKFCYMTKMLIEKACPPTIEEYAVQFVAAGVQNVVRCWISKPDRENPIKFAIIVNSIIMNGISHSVNK